MRKNSKWPLALKYLFRTGLRYRRLLPSKKCQAFGHKNDNSNFLINHIYVINLKRQPSRWKDIEKELQQILNVSGTKLNSLVERFNAIDAKDFHENPPTNGDLDPVYTLEDQLFVEPQPLTMPTNLDLHSKIQMSRPEIAVAYSHIELWKRIASNDNDYTLILEDDIWFKPGFSNKLNEAWIEITENKQNKFDILYLSFEEVKNGAPKTFISEKIFRPVRGLWNLSGYVISKSGAKKLLELLPCKGPVDLWINHQFKFLNVLATHKSIISQRLDLTSTNSYSILPSLTKIGAITSENAALFHITPNEVPVFAFGHEKSGLTSLAMALSILGYRCCSDLDTLPKSELKKIFAGNNEQIFNAYVNIGCLSDKIVCLKETYPTAKFIFTTNLIDILDEGWKKIIANFDKKDILLLSSTSVNKWQLVCEHLRSSPPDCIFPDFPDKAQRQMNILRKQNDIVSTSIIEKKYDASPWLVEMDRQWQGIDIIPTKEKSKFKLNYLDLDDNLESLNDKFWTSRNDTFTDNLALFRSGNLEFKKQQGLILKVKEDDLGVRKYSAAALTSTDKFLYGKFEIILKASNMPGIITGFFLHRDSPRQEIDVEITGIRPNRMMINVFYNPGDEGTKFDYGYRGSPCYVDLGFDASKSFHKYTIEWDECEIRWFVDDRLVHRRVDWNPTPIPHLPMSLHLNIWPCRSKELAGKLSNKKLPATSFVRSISVVANRL